MEKKCTGGDYTLLLNEFKHLNRVMKLILLFLVLCVSTVFSENVHSQTARVRIDANQLETKDIIRQIEEQTDYLFVYNHKKVDLSHRVSLNAEAISVGEVLSRIFEHSDIIYMMEGNNILLMKKEVLPQQSKRQVKGIVKDSNGDPIIGANVIEKGTTNGTVTDLDGYFSLEVPKGATIEVSYIGYLSHEQRVENQKNLVVVLNEDTQNLNEVVVVGYGSQSRRSVTGSVIKVDMKKTENLPNTNVSQVLRGRVAGVQFTDNGRPGAEGNILVRGQRSITANNSPLVIVDGMFFNGTFSEINSNDVESIEILKDASAAAIYGSRAANGVILVTTKKGTTEKPTIRFNSYVGVSDWSNKIKLLSPERYIERKLDYRKQAGLESDPSKLSEYISNSEYSNYMAGNSVNGWDVISQTGLVQSYDLNVSGMTDRTNYFISGAITKEKGIIHNDKADRISFRMNIDNKITDWLKIGVNSQFSHRNLSGIAASVNDAYYLSPFGDIYYNNDSSDPTTHPTDDSNAYSLNPLFNSIMNKNEEIQQNLFANVYALVDIPFVKGLSYRVNYSPNFRWYHKYDAVPEYQNEDWSQISTASKVNQKNFDWSLENIINYDRYFKDLHRVQVTLMYGRSHRGFDKTIAKGSNFVNDALGWDNLALAKVQQTESEGSSVEEISYMARVNYGFMDRYLLTLTTRRDGCSVFGANNKYATFPSVALAWIASEETFLKNISAINMAKLRFSYGATGNQAIDPYSSLSKSSNAEYVFGDGSTSYIGVYPSTMANSSLKWETTKTMNIALDFLLFNGRLGGSIEYYTMDTDDLLLKRAIPTMTGFSSVMSNIGATNNKGIELTLNTVNIKNDDFEWSTDITFSSNKNKIVHLYRSDMDHNGIEDNDIGNKWFIGHPVSVNYDYELDGIYQVGDQIPEGFKPGDYKIVDQTGEGKITPDDRKVLSSKEPKYRLGVNNIFRYRNWTFSVFVNSLLGWQGNFRYLGMMGSPQPNFPERAMNGIDAGWWTEENRSNSRPALTYLNPRGHGFYQNRNFARIQDVSLSYDFSKDLLSRWKMGGLKVYLSAKNLYTFTSYVGFDPENNMDENLGYPMSRSIVGGINILF